MEDRELQAFLKWRSHYDQDSGGCHMKDLIGSLETSLGIFEQCTEPLADGATDTEPDIVPGKSTYIRPSRAKAAVAARIQRESTELFQSAFDEVRGITVVSGYQSILDIRIGEEHQQAKGKRSGSSKLKSQPDFAIRRPEKGDKRSYGWNDRFTNVLCKMMYVSGETAEPSVETTSMIEDIVRQQVIELVSLLHAE